MLEEPSETRINRVRWKDMAAREDRIIGSRSHWRPKLPY